MLIDVPYQSDNHLEDALCKVAKSYEVNQNCNQKISNLVGAQKAFEKAKNGTFTKLTEEQIEPLGRTFLNKTLNETLHDLLIYGNINQFEQLRKEFGISDKKTWSIKVQTLVETEDCAELNKLLNSKSFPFGYEMLIDLCISTTNLRKPKTICLVFNQKS